MRKLIGVPVVTGLFLACGAASGDESRWNQSFTDAEEFLPERLRALAREASEPIELQWSTDESMAQWIGPDGLQYRIDFPTARISKAPVNKTPAASAVSNRVNSSDGRYSVFARDHNLFVEEAGATRQLTFDGEVWRSFDARYSRSNPLAVSASQERSPRVRFLGSGSWLVAERWDFRKVGSVWLANSLQTPRPTTTEQRMAYPGDRDLPLPELWLIDAATGKQRLIDNGGWAYVGNMDVGAGGIFPSPDNSQLYFVRMTRGYEVVELCRVAVPSGEVEVIWREEGKPYFTVRSPDLTFVGSGEQLIWRSDRDGRIHYYLLDANKRRIVRQLTRGNMTASRVLHVDAARRILYFEAYGDGEGGDPYYIHGFRVSLDGGPVQRLDREEAVHSFAASPSGRYFVDTFSTVAEPPRTVLRDRSGKIVATLASANIDALLRTGWQPPVRFKTKAVDDRTDLYGLLWKPVPFDSTRRYPVIATVYPGPSTEDVPVRFAENLGYSATALAQLGFIVVATGVRGASPLRGKDYQLYSRTHGNLRDYPLSDLRRVIENLARERPWMDLGRVGVSGHSGGGFMAVAAMLHDPDFYAAGVASAGNHDNNIYEMNSSEFYWGDPRSAPLGGASGYATSAEKASRLAAPLLLIHGEADDDVSLAHTLRLIDALIGSDKLFDVLVLPGQGHHYEHGDYVRRRVWRHFLNHLGASDRTR